MREVIMAELDKVLPCFPISAQTDLFDVMADKPDDFIVLKKSHVEPSTINRLGSWTYWEIQIYVSKDSLLPIDNYFDKVDKLIKTMDVERTQADNGDYYEQRFEKYRNIIQIRTPRGEI